MIVVNCRYLTQRTTGVQRFAERVTRELTALRDDIVLVAPPGELRQTHVSVLPVRQVGSLRGHAWEQVDLPVILRRDYPGGLLLSLANTGPAWYRNQAIVHHDVTYRRYPESYSRSFRVAYRLLGRTLLPRARQIVTVSEFSRHEIAETYAIDRRRIAVIPNAVDERFVIDPDRRAAASPRYLLAVSSPSEHKNFDRLIRAFREVRKQHPELELRIVGAAASTLTRTLSGVDEGPGVTFLGRLDDAALIRQYQGALAFVFPSLYEGFGLPPLEAQSCGVPVAASDIPPCREVLKDTACYFDPRDESSIASALVSVCNDRTLRDALTASAAANVERFSWRSSSKRLSDLLDDMLGATESGEK